MSRTTKPATRKHRETSALVPAAARDSALTAVEQVWNAEAIEVFAKAVGGRERLADTLAVAGSGTEVERITTLLLDPRYYQWSLSRLCGMVGITVADLFASYRKAMIARAQIEATHIIASKLPPIVTDVMDKALSDPTVERHKLALELGQLLEKKGGIVVNQNATLAAVGATTPGSLEQLQQAVGDVLFGSKREEAIDVSPLAPPDPDEDQAEDDEEPEPAEVDEPDAPLSERGIGDPPADVHAEIEPYPV